MAKLLLWYVCLLRVWGWWNSRISLLECVSVSQNYVCICCPDSVISSCYGWWYGSCYSVMPKSFRLLRQTIHQLQPWHYLSGANRGWSLVLWLVHSQHNALLCQQPLKWRCAMSFSLNKHKVTILPCAVVTTYTHRYWLLFKVLVKDIFFFVPLTQCIPFFYCTLKVLWVNSNYSKCWKDLVRKLEFDS